MMVLSINRKPVGCLTNNSLAESWQFIQTCKTTAKGAITQLPTLHSYAIPFEAVYVKDIALMTYSEIQEIARNREMIEWDLSDPEENIGEAGWAFIENLDLAGSVEDFIKFTGTLTGYGFIRDSPLTFNVWYQNVDTPVDEGGNYVLVAP
jgi:hypothetical protein